MAVAPVINIVIATPVGSKAARTAERTTLTHGTIFISLTGPLKHAPELAWTLIVNNAPSGVVFTK
jgi:hypothetical protein